MVGLMGLTEKLAAELKADEGFVPHGYKDSLGRLTIGYGRLIDGRLGGGISQQEATYLLRHDVQRCWGEYERLLGHLDISPQRKLALANMLFNLGLPKFCKFRRMRAAIESGDWEMAAQEALDSRWAQQTGKRAQRIAARLKSSADWA